MKKRLFTLALTLVAAVAANAVPAKRGIWRTMQLADGKSVSVELRGDEFMSYWQDAQGNCYTVNPQNRLQAANMTQLRQASTVLREKAGNVVGDMSRMKANRAARKIEYKGEKRCLIILAQFSDKKFSMADPKAFYTRVANEKGFSDHGFMGSVADYFSAQSGGQFNITFDVAGPYNLGTVKSFGEDVKDSQGNRLYDKNPGGMVSQACTMAYNDGVDFTPYDWDGDRNVEMVYVLYAGEGQATGGSEDTIWPHKSQLNSSVKVGNKYVSVYACSNEVSSTPGELMGIGTICHEFSHCMGYPDVYDTDYAGFYGMGTWDPMCSGSYNGNSFCPAGYTAYEKMVAGWIEPIELMENASYTDIKPTADGGDAYIFYNPGNANEYYIVENRQRKGWDKYLAGAGIIVNHITYDKTAWDWNIPNTNRPGYNTFERITIIPADGQKTENTEGADPWGTSDSKRSLTNSSRPSCTTNTPNINGSNLMNISLTQMTVSGGLASFKFTNHNIGTGEVDGYALHETFDVCSGTGGNDGKFKSSGAFDKNFAAGAFSSDAMGWEGTAKYGASQCVRIGSTGGADSKVTTPEFTLNGESKLTFRAAPWTGDGSSLTLSITGGTLGTTSFTMTEDKFTDFSTTIKGNGKVKISFQGERRWFLDEVFVEEAGASGIFGIEDNAVPVVTRVYSLDGRYLGNSLDALGKGLYIVNGKKVLK